MFCRVQLKGTSVQILAIYSLLPPPAPHPMTPVGSVLLGVDLEGRSLCLGSVCCLGGSSAVTGIEECFLHELALCLWFIY